MRVSREQFLENREKILAAAARLFRERGFDEVGVADVMQAAGLTHGGFYGHFKSKDDLIAQATGGCAQAFVEQWTGVVEAEGPRPCRPSPGDTWASISRAGLRNSQIAAHQDPRSPAAARRVDR